LGNAPSQYAYPSPSDRGRLRGELLIHVINNEKIEALQMELRSIHSMPTARRLQTTWVTSAQR